jgi:hypothetical protein
VVALVVRLTGLDNPNGEPYTLKNLLITTHPNRE